MPSRQRRVPFLIGLLGAAILLVTVLVLAGLAVIDYSLAVALLVGIAAAWVLVRVLRAVAGWLRQARRPLLWVGLLVVFVVVLAGGVLLVVASMALAPMATALPVEEEPAEVTEEVPRTLAITGYRVTIEPGDVPAAGVWVTEEISYSVRQGADLIYSDLVVTYPGRHLASTRRGFLLREVTVEPLDGNPYGYFALPLPDGTEMDGRLCRYSTCSQTIVRLEDFPARSFYAARGVREEAIETVPYVNTETISWTTTDLSDGITFAYIPPPFQALRPLLTPLVGASKASEWLVGLVGMLGTVLAGPIIKPVVENIIEDKVGEFFSQVFGKRRSASSRTKSARSSSRRKK